MKRCDFVDWMKAVGMFLIVFGHFFGDPFDQFTQPVYPKQLGVAMFVFIMGWGLGKVTGPRYQVSYNRLFPMFFWGIVIALFISVISYFVITHRLFSALMLFLIFFLPIPPHGLSVRIFILFCFGHLFYTVLR